uniref:Uncharacterized protein n=1 Tax=Arundo donax TaxID=35708 RepID=A0A0A9CRK2_ARUDO
MRPSFFAFHSSRGLFESSLIAMLLKSSALGDSLCLLEEGLSFPSFVLEQVPKI